MVIHKQGSTTECKTTKLLPWAWRSANGKIKPWIKKHLSDKPSGFTRDRRAVEHMLAQHCNIIGMAHWRWADKQWSPQDFMLDVLPVATLPINRGLGPAPMYTGYTYQMAWTGLLKYTNGNVKAAIRVHKQMVARFHTKRSTRHIVLCLRDSSKSEWGSE